MSILTCIWLSENRYASEAYHVLSEFSDVLSEKHGNTYVPLWLFLLDTTFDEPINLAPYKS